MEYKQETKLLEYFSQFQFLDILAFGNILGVESKENEEFEDYITEIISTFSDLPRVRRRQLLKLAKDVAGANIDIKKSLESQNVEDGSK